MKFHDVPQGNVSWFKLRMGRVTASEMGNLLTPDFELRKGQTPQTYVYVKLAELWRHKPLINTGSWATEQGQLRQEEAIPWLALDKGWKIRDGGFIESDDGLSGCSPDGLVDSQFSNLKDCPLASRESLLLFGIECKCPEPPNHVRYLIEGNVPPAYIVQVHASLYVTGFAKWVFFSYQRGFPPLIIEVQRDEAIIAKIEAAVKWFHAELAKGKERISQYQ